MSRDPQALYKLGLSQALQGKAQDAESSYREAVQLHPGFAEAYSDLGVTLWMQGRHDEAIWCYQKAAELRPDLAEPFLNWGAILTDRGSFQDALSIYRKALELNPEHALVHNNIGVTLQKLNQIEESVTSFRRTISIKPEYDQAYCNLGISLNAQGSYEDAVVAFRQAIELQPNNAQSHFHLGLSLYKLHNCEESIACYRKAIELQPDLAEAYLNLGVAMVEYASLTSDLDKMTVALDCYQKALELKPDCAEAHFNTGLILLLQRKIDEAAYCLRKATDLRIQCPKALLDLGFALRKQNQIGDAQSAYREWLNLRTSKMKSNGPVTKLGSLLFEFDGLPVIYQDATEITKGRQHLIRCLNEALWLVSRNGLYAEDRIILKEILFRITNFELAYQQQNDRDFLLSYSRLSTAILSSELKDYLAPGLAPRSTSKIRLGVASEHLRAHNGASWVYGWLANLPKDDYEFFLYSLNGITDEVTRKFAELGTLRWLAFKEDNYLDSLRIIKADNLDVLLLPDVGMCPSSRIISLTKLAPVQCAGWGHPVTTGSPNVDYYLSSEFMETAEADCHYSEQLVRLPNIGIYIVDPDLDQHSASRCDYGLPEDRILYGSVQSLFKYLPQFDYVYPAIARKLPNAFFVFIGSESKSVTAAFKQRLGGAFGEAGLKLDHYVRILPRLPFAKFSQLLSVIDVALDSIGFSGGITAINALNRNCPVITLPGEYMRSRLCHAMLKMIGLDELSASSLDEYISLSAKIGADRQMRSTIVQKITAQKHRLFKDMQCVEFLDNFLKSKVAALRVRSLQSASDEFHPREFPIPQRVPIATSITQ